MDSQLFPRLENDFLLFLFLRKNIKDTYIKYFNIYRSIYSLEIKIISTLSKVDKKKRLRNCILDRNSDSLFILGKHKGKMGYREGEIRRSESIIRSDKDTAIIQARLFRV